MDDSNGAVPIANNPGSFAYGYDVMIAKKICEANGWELEVMAIGWDGLVPALQAGQIDAVIAGQSMTEDRMAEVDMAVYGKTVSLIGEMDNIMIAKEAIEMILNGSRHKSVYGFLEHKKETLKLKEFKDLVGIHDDEIEFKDGIDFDEEMMQ